MKNKNKGGGGYLCSKNKQGIVPKKIPFFANQIEEKIPPLEVFLKGGYLIFSLKKFACDFETAILM